VRAGLYRTVCIEGVAVKAPEDSAIVRKHDQVVVLVDGVRAVEVVTLSRAQRPPNRRLQVTVKPVMPEHTGDGGNIEYKTVRPILAPHIVGVVVGDKTDAPLRNIHIKRLKHDTVRPKRLAAGKYKATHTLQHKPEN